MCASAPATARSPSGRTSRRAAGRSLHDGEVTDRVEDSPEEEFSVAEAVGGPLGIAESALPAVTFVTAFTALGQDAALAAWIAVGVGASLAAARVLRGQTVQYALAGLFGVAMAAFIVSRTGRAEDFFLPGLLANAAYALGCAGSVAIGRPAVGILLGALSGEGMAWRQDAARVLAYTRATWVWVGVFCVRLVVQLPLYLAGAVVVLGVARVAMGVPLFALAAWISWLMLRASGETVLGGAPGVARR